jgi:hypothetical protein
MDFGPLGKPIFIGTVLVKKDLGDISLLFILHFFLLKKVLKGLRQWPIPFLDPGPLGGLVGFLPLRRC